MTKSKKKVSILSIFLYSALALLVVLVVSLMAMKMNNRIPTIFGYSCIRIVSPSMEPSIPTGGYILIKKVDPAQVQVGDIITFYSSDASINGLPNTHRVTQVVEQSGKRTFRTKGDNNSVEDVALVQADSLIGKYQSSLTFLSKIGALLQNKKVFLICIIVPAAGLLLWEMIHLAKKSKEIREEQALEDQVEQLVAEALAKQQEKDNTP